MIKISIHEEGTFFTYPVLKVLEDPDKEYAMLSTYGKNALEADLINTGKKGILKVYGIRYTHCLLTWDKVVEVENGTDIYPIYSEKDEL